jgi:hypothetical protein
MSAVSPLIPLEIPRLQANLSHDERLMLKLNGSSHFAGDSSKTLAWVVQDLTTKREYAVVNLTDIDPTKYHLVGMAIIATDQKDTSLSQKVQALKGKVQRGLLQQPKKMFMTEWFLVNCRDLNKRAGSAIIDTAVVDQNVSRRAPPPPVPPRPVSLQKPVSKVKQLAQQFELTKIAS